MYNVHSIFHAATAKTSGESFEALLEHPHVLIERIVSSGTQPPTQYDQDHDEWVLLLQGQAEMTVGGQHVSLKAGDYLLLPSGVPHEVSSTSQGALWLAVHLR